MHENGHSWYFRGSGISGMSGVALNESFLRHSTHIPLGWGRIINFPHLLHGPKTSPIQNHHLYTIHI